MDVTAITTLISSVGFPIVMCGAMGWFINSLTAEYRNSIKEITDSHTEEVKQLTEAVNQLTLSLSRIENLVGEK